MKQKRILVVDDEQDLCEILLYNLKAADFEAEAANSAEIALDKGTSQYDLLILDVMMPGMSGFELAEKLKADRQTSRIPIIFLTAKDTEDDTLQGFGLGADDYVTKPFSVREVVARVKAVLARSQSNTIKDSVISFEDYDRKFLQPFDEVSDWHLLLFSLVVMVGLAFLLHRYARRMDERISREQAAKENQMRRELTQNIAHELKTPVTSILGYTDTILDDPQMPSQTQRQFIERTNAQAKRLTALLQDISTLNRMDYAAHQLTMERIDVAAIVSDIAEETAIALEKRRMKLNNCLPQDIVIQGNPSLIYSIFRNLVDNAISYAGEGTTIEISAEETDDNWVFFFSDNGVGIAPKHLPRIFERFYRIDKSRSRQMGGTGLGLAIVKNAVLLHGGTITVRLSEKGGLEFEFTLRKE